MSRASSEWPHFKIQASVVFRTLRRDCRRQLHFASRRRSRAPPYYYDATPAAAAPFFFHSLFPFFLSDKLPPIPLISCHCITDSYFSCLPGLTDLGS